MEEDDGAGAHILGHPLHHVFMLEIPVPVMAVNGPHDHFLAFSTCHGDHVLIHIPKGRTHEGGFFAKHGLDIFRRPLNFTHHVVPNLLRQPGMGVGMAGNFMAGRFNLPGRFFKLTQEIAGHKEGSRHIILLQHLQQPVRVVHSIGAVHGNGHIGCLGIHLLHDGLGKIRHSDGAFHFADPPVPQPHAHQMLAHHFFRYIHFEGAGCVTGRPVLFTQHLTVLVAELHGVIALEEIGGLIGFHGEGHLLPHKAEAGGLFHRHLGQRIHLHLMPGILLEGIVFPICKGNGQVSLFLQPAFGQLSRRFLFTGRNNKRKGFRLVLAGEGHHYIFHRGRLCLHLHFIAEPGIGHAAFTGKGHLHIFSRRTCHAQKRQTQNRQQNADFLHLFSLFPHLFR